DLGITSLVSLKSLTLEEVPVYKRKSSSLQIHGGYRHVQKMRVRCEHKPTIAKMLGMESRVNK
ncbi:hypothetical protein, partial [Paenibacillus popilliae]|uniref:hypothetical protein n=1 Tax=Paenibacillus popilliae TaxID=78057 RepID=UPI0005A6C563